MGFLRRRKDGYKAAWRVEKYRAAAIQLREQDPESYAQALAQANGSEAESAARRDPDAYVALLLAAFDDAEREDPQAFEDDEATPEASDFDYWPQLDLEAIYLSVGAFFADIHKEKGVSQQYYPGFVVRRMIAVRVLDAAASINPEVLNDDGAASALAGVDEEDFFFTENAGLDEALELYLVRQHLSQLVDAVVRALSAE